MIAKWSYLFLLLATFILVFLNTTNTMYANYPRGTSVCTPGTGNQEDINLDSTNPRVPNKHEDSTTCWCYNDGECAGSPNVCINNICRAHTSAAGGACGHTPDCNSDLNCVNNICQPKIPCDDPSLNSYGACNNTGTKCFWHAPNKTHASWCSENTGSSYGMACGSDGGHCWGSKEKCWYDTYCSLTDEGPVSTPPPSSSKKQSGDNCDISKTNECDTNLTCDYDSEKDDICMPINSKSAGSECNVAIPNSACKTGTVCDSSVIDKSKAVCINERSKVPGAWCVKNSACQSNICEGFKPGIIQGKCTSVSTTTPSVSPSPSITQPPGNRNSCELDDNTDNAFKCLSAAEAPSGSPSTTYSTPTSNSGYYSCGSKGGSCFRNDSIYSKRGGLGSPNNSPSTTTAPGQGSPAPSSDVCSQAGKGNVDTVFSKPNGYEGSTCDHKLIGETDPRTAKPGRVYADRYRCTKTGADGTNYVDVLIPSANASCDKIPWLVSPSPTPSICKAYQGQSCLLDSKGNPDNTTGPCCLPDQNLSCVDPQKSGTPTCQFIGGKAPTSTPGAPSICTPGTKSTGCPCDTPTACGCASTHNPEPSLDDPNKYYCVPFASNLKWCSVTKTTMSSTTDPALCKGSTPFTTPTPASAGCPNDSKHLCVPTNYCQAGYGPSNDTYANTACADWNPDTPQCYIKGKQALSTCIVTTSPSPSASISPKPSPAASGCPADNGDGRVNSCQATCNGSYPNVRTVGNADCTAAYGTIRGACCTSN